MITLRKANERGHANHGWLDSWHTFSFANYYDPKHMGFRSLRVINDDRIKGGGGFGTHPHEDMEIMTYVLEGALRHQDSLGTGAVIKPGEAQRMTAGTGIAHSEYNDSKTDTVRLLQIWIEPAREGLKPGYEQKTFPLVEQRNRLHLIASSDGRAGTITINQDVLVSAGRLDAGTAVTYAIAPQRHVWLQVANGALEVNGHTIATGDALAISKETSLTIRAKEPSEILVFDLA